MSDESSNTATEATRDVFEFNLTPSTLSVAIKFLMANRDSVGNIKPMESCMVWGAMGVGKSQIVQQVAEGWGCRIVALHLPQFDPTDIKGVPVYFPPDHEYVDPETKQVQKLGGRVAWVASSYLPQQYESDELGDHSKVDIIYNFAAAEDVKLIVMDKKTGAEVARVNDGRNPDFDDNNIVKKFTVVNPRKRVAIEFATGVDLSKYKIRLEDKAVLFLDELSASAPETMNAALQLVLDRRVGEYDVPNDVPVVAAGNRESDQAFVNPMPAPLANRFCHLRLVPNTDDWIEWAIANGINPEVIGYLKWKGSKALFSFVQSEQIEGDLGFPTPRSWAKLAPQLDPSLPDMVINAIVCGFIGKKRGNEFINYRKTCTLLPSTDDILQGKEVRMPEKTDTGAKWSLAIALCFKLKDYYDKYYDHGISTDYIEQQPQEWKTAGESMTTFIHENLGREMTVLAIHIITRHLKISFTKFCGDKYDGFAEKYRPIIRKMVVN